MLKLAEVVYSRLLAVAGSAEIGDFCTFAGQVGIAPHVKVGNKSTVAAKSGVTKSLEGKVYAGMPARDIRKHNKSMASINLVEKLYKKSGHFSSEC